MSHFVLADCNNFYASCERLFNPKLNGIPVIVLSNNDGCVVARSQEAKKIGIKMGQPYFQIKDFCRLHRVAVYSSNYRLYGDLSERVMNVLTEASPEIEIYSIDEAFMRFSTSSPDDLVATCVKLRQKVKKWVGLPISLGIAPTKTLAKIANDLAKKDQTGVFNLSSPIVQKEVLQKYPIGDVWGIGSNLSARLRGMSILTAWDFKEMDPSIIRKKLGVVGERMLWELRGLSCLQLEEAKAKKSITSSRSFGKVVTEKEEIAEALATFVSTACVKLRAQGSCANAISVFLESLEGDQNMRRHFSMVKTFPFPTSDTAQMISAAKQILSKIFVPDERYKKCGIILLDLIANDLVIPDLFLGGLNPKRTALMQTVDNINARYGKNTVFFCALGTNPQWKMRSDKRSQYSTTDWLALPIVKA
ncbi:MAG: Y-family DNA polymerase [Parachlamydiaceae bacterium]|nr:Y-family DNA polymerase [Parachlamydiaceae bacterium]